MSTTKQTAPYGSWPSKITTDVLTRGIVRFSEPQLDNGLCYWLESRPEEKGRGVVVCQLTDGNNVDVTPANMNVRTCIQEYGGGNYRVHQGVVYFVNNDDQCVYKLEGCNQEPILLSPKGQYRYADFCVDEERQQLICICEIHKSEQEPESCIVALKLDGSSSIAFNVLVFGNDFYSNPRISPDGEYLSWLTWKHPHMPWDNSECWLAEFSSLGLLHKHRKIAGGADDDSRKESVFQPQWSPLGELYFVSDRNQWWNLYRYNTQTKIVETVVEMEAEFATPQWVFGMSTYGFLNSYSIFCCYTQSGQWHAGLVDTLSKQLRPLSLDFTDIEGVCCDEDNDTAIFVAANTHKLNQIVHWRAQNITTIKKNHALDQQYFSTPETIEFPNRHQQQVYGFYYPPHNPEYLDESSLPPLIVMCHGGPTGATRMSLNYKVQYWTSRGFAVLDINYSGSTGFGRTYRDRLKTLWGVLDVEDICDGAQYLVSVGKADPERLAVRGSSAGGFSVLAALTFHDCFKAGASLYGIGDLSLLAADTHKFESRYMDQLIGPYPEVKVTYEARSPLLHIDKLNCPVIFLQGLEDKVVPPNQAEGMVNSLVTKNIPVAYVTFEDEGHGFRNADNIRYSLEVEYAFYASVFALTPTENLPNVPFVKQTISSS